MCFKLVHIGDNRESALLLFSNNSPKRRLKNFPQHSPSIWKHAYVQLPKGNVKPQLLSFLVTVSPVDIFCCYFQVTSHFTEDFLFNAAIARLMGLTNTLSVSVPVQYIEIDIIIVIVSIWKSHFYHCVYSECNSQGGAAQCGV